jgi:hypothetical protein
VSEYSRLCIEWQVAALQVRRARKGRARGMQGNPIRKIYQEMASWLRGNGPERIAPACRQSGHR